MEQQAIADKTAAGVALLWGILQYDRLDETTPAWLHAVTLQVEQQFRISEQAAFEFVQGSKWAVEPLSDPLKMIVTEFPVKDFQLAMRATGPASVKRATGAAFNAPVNYSEALSTLNAQNVPTPGGSTPQWVLNRIKELEASKARRDAAIAANASESMAVGKLNSTGAAVRHALNGGRGEVEQLVVVDAKKRFADRKVIGWARFTEDSETGPCYFCAILASQGAVYLNADSFSRSNSMIREVNKNRKSRRAFIGDGPAKVHDHCKCTLRPVYREQDKMDERARFFEQQWKDRFESYAKLPDARQNPDVTDINRFRAVYKMPPPYKANPAVNLEQVRRNRELAARELGENSPQVKWFDRTINALEIA